MFTKPLPKSAIAPLRRSNIATRTGGGVRGWTDIISKLEIGRNASAIARGQQNDGAGRKESTDGGAPGCLNSRAELVTNAPRRAEPNGKMIRRAKGAGRLRIAQSPRKLKLRRGSGQKKGNFVADQRRKTPLPPSTACRYGRIAYGTAYGIARGPPSVSGWGAP